MKIVHPLDVVPASDAAPGHFVIRVVNDVMEVQPVDQFGLSPREDELLFHLWEGRTDDQIAADMMLSRYTVREYKRRLQLKVGAARPSQILSCVFRRLPHVQVERADSRE